MRKSLFFSCIAAIVFVVVISAVTANVSGVKKSPFEFHDIQLNGNSRVTAVVVSNDSDIPLKKENTGVTVDGQTIGDFSLTPVNDESTALILAFDVSRSMNGIPLASAKKYASYLLAPITDGNYVMLMTFGNYIRILENLTDDKDTLISKTDSLTALEQKTLLYRAISDGLKLAEKSKTAKTSMLVITDAKDDHSDITFEELLKDFKKPHIPIHVMVYGNNRLYFESLDNITKLTKGTMLVNPGFEEIQGLSRAIFIPKRVKYLIDYKYAGAAGKHECLVKLKYQGGEISLKREFALPPSGATTVPAGTAQSTPQSTPEPKSTVTAVTKAESPGSIGELMLNYQWLILLIIIFLLFLIVLILLLSKKKGADTSVTFAVKDMQSELKLINARLSEIHKSELIITDNEGLEGFIHSLMNKFVEGTHENIKNILRRLEIETKNAIANIGEIKSQEYVLLQENISNLSGVLQSRISVVESALERIREMYKTEQSAGAERAQAMVADILSAKIAELKQELTVSFNSKYETLTGALSDIPSMKIQSETYYAGVESRLSGLSLEISTMAANFETSLSAAISQAVQETDYEKIAEANKETLKDFENKLEMLTLTTCGIPTLKAGLEDFMLAIESKLTTLSTELSTMAAAFDNRLETTLKQSVPTPVHEKIDYEKIADAGKETLKDFENRLEALSS
ncbi:MAG: VWA domain-containing protein, partial [Nitrospirae bacterium YQR-1]